MNPASQTDLPVETGGRMMANEMSHPTDEEILAFGRAARDGTMHDAEVRYLCTEALGLTLASSDDVAAAKSRIAAALKVRRLTEQAIRPASDGAGLGDGGSRVANEWSHT